MVLTRILAAALTVVFATSHYVLANESAETHLSSAKKYLVLAQPDDIYVGHGNWKLYHLNEWLKKLNIPRNADAGTIRGRFEVAIGHPEFLQIAVDEAYLDCKEIRNNWRIITKAYGLRRETSESIENYLLYYGARAYGFCARKINQLFNSDTKPLPSEKAFDRIIAYGSEPLLELEECDTLSEEQLFERARQVDLVSKTTKVQRMLQVANEVRDIPSSPPEPILASINLFNFLAGHCFELEIAFGRELGVLSLAYVFGGDNLATFQPRLRKLVEYQRICNARFNEPRVVKRALKDLFAGERASFWDFFKRSPTGPTVQ